MKQRHLGRKLLPATVRPHLEALENRWCPSCVIRQDGDVLFITGDRLDNRIDIAQVADTIQVACDGGEAQSFRGVKRIEANTWTGNDAVTAQFTPGPDDFTLRAELGAGDDTFTATFFTETIAPAPSDLPPGPCKLDVLGQQGNDRLSLFLGGPDTSPIPQLFNAELAVNFDGGGGGDTALIGIINVAVNAPMSLATNLGGGNDIASLNAYNVAFSAEADTNVDLGGGDDNAMIIYGNVAFNADATTNVVGGGGRDTVAQTWWATSVAPGASVMGDVDGGGGGDAVSFITFGGTVARDARFDIEVHGGDGADVLRLSSVGLLVEGGADWCQDGGDGSDVVDARLDFDPDSHGMIVVEVMGSAGDDDLTLGISGLGGPDTFQALVDGGTGFDVAFVSRNVLVRNCEEVFFIE